MFQSKIIPGAEMNRYGTVFVPVEGTDVAKRHASRKERDEIFREARKAGHFLVPADDKDAGMVWSFL